MCIENYIGVVEEMLARGEKITLQEVRRVAGKGSYSTISEAIKVVLSRGLIPADVTGPVPEILTDATQALWHDACKLASAAVASERLALHSVRVASQESQRELTILADTLALQADELMIQLKNLQVERDVAERRAHEAESGLKATRQILKELGLKPAKAEGEKGQTTNAT